MDNPELYRIANEMQRYDVACTITEYGSKMKWLSEGGDSLIDLGSGSGDVLMDFIYPRMPQNLLRFVCSDVNATMVEYARKQFGHLKGTQFRIFDMATSTENLPSDLMGQFDHVTSFFALMYSPNQRQTFHNIYNLLKPEGGDCLLASLTYHPIFDGYRMTSQMEKWSKYMSDVDSFISPQQYATNAKGEFQEFLAEAGFRDYSVVVQPKIFVYDSLEVYKTNMLAVNPFVKRIPTLLQDHYMDDIVSAVCQSIGLEKDCLRHDGKCPIPHNLAIIYARKSSEKCIQ